MNQSQVKPIMVIPAKVVFKLAMVCAFIVKNSFSAAIAPTLAPQRVLTTTSNPDTISSSSSLETQITQTYSTVPDSGNSFGIWLVKKIQALSSISTALKLNSSRIRYREELPCDISRCWKACEQFGTQMQVLTT
jgi:hypothetical protein